MSPLKNINNSWTLFWSLSLLLLLLTIYPFINNDYPALADYANHLSRLHLLTGTVADGWQEYYSIQEEIIANLALDVIASWLVKLGLSPEVALRIFAAAACLVVISGVYAVACAINLTPPWLVLWTFLFVFNRYFIWGFLNYFFSVGLGLILFSVWIRAHQYKKITQTKLQFLVGVLLIPVLLCHLMGYAIALLCIFLYEAGLAYSKKADFKSIIFNQLNVVSKFIPSLLFYLFVCAHGEGYEIIYQDVIRSKVSGITSPFLSYNFYLIYLYATTFTVSIYFATKKLNLKKLAVIFPNYAFIIPTTFFVLFLVLPSAMMGSYYLDKRIFVIVFFTALALAVINFNTKNTLILISAVVFSQIIKVAEVNLVWQEQSKDVKEILNAFEQMTPNARIESYNFGDDYFMPTPPIQHIVTLAIYKNGAFVPTLFARPSNIESIKYKPPYDLRAYTTGTYHQKDSLQMMAYGCEPFYTHPYYDYTLVTFMSQKPKVPECYKALKEGKHFVLYEVNN
jgi:hypothetical protein